jgi:hypothetical protein
MAGPTVTALVFILWALAAPTAFGNRLLGADGDPARHIRHGLTMLLTGHLIHADPFSFTRAGAPFLGFEYGSQLVLGLAYRAAGLAGVAVLTGLALAATYALTARLMMRRRVDPAFAFLVTTAAAILSSMHWVARPHIFSQLLVVVLLDWLERDRPAPIWWYVPLFALWANLHGGFVYGLILIGIYLAAHAIDGLRGDSGARDRARRTALAFAVSLAATLLNPFGLRLHAHVLWYLQEPFIKRWTTEFNSPDFRTLGGKLLLLTLLGIVAGFALSRRRPRTTHLLVILANVAFALLAQRNIAIFALTALPLLAIHLDSAWRHLPEPPNFRASFAQAEREGRTWPYIGAAAAGMLALAAAGGRIGRLQLVPDRFESADFPTAAVAAARHAGLHGRIYNQFVWGGYMLLEWPEQKVFIDGGTDFYGESLLRDYLEVWTLQPGWRGVLQRWNVDLAMITPGTPLAGELEREPDWHIWYCDSTAVILRKGPSAAPPAACPALPQP